MLTNLYPPVVSGSSTQSHDLARELVRQGHEVIVITARIFDHTPEVEFQAGVTVYRIGAFRLPKMSIALNFPWLNVTMTPRNRRRMLSILEEERVDVVHVHNHMFDMALNGAWLSRRLGIPFVVTIHTLIKHSNPIYNALLYPLDRFFLKWFVLGKADGIVCPDFNVQEYLRERFGREGVVIPYGIQLDPSPPGEAEKVCSEFHLAGKRVILSIGHVHALRNREDLIRAFPHVLRAVPEAVLVIVGNVTDALPEAIARELGVTDRVIFTGAQPRSRIPAFLELAELEAHWLNQDDPEKTSFGVASMEAMSQGKAILAAANPNTYGPGILENGRNVIVVDAGKPEALADTIVSLMKDKARRSEIGEAARQTAAEHFSWQSVGRRTIELYEASERQARARMRLP
jgi:1,2-diacylglycerol 3-alpha-glucosyltransferase